MTATVDLARALHATIDARVGLALPINPVGRARGTIVEVQPAERTATILRAGETIPVRAKHVLLADTLVPGDDVLLDEVPGSLPLIVGILGRDLVSGLGIVSVLTHGAKGDGRTDDLVAIQRALTAGAGGIVILPGSRTYVVSGTVVVPAGTTLLMHGATLILQSGVTPRHLLDVQASTLAEPIRIEGGTLDGDRDSNDWDGLTGPSAALVAIGAGHGVQVEDAYLKSGWYGVLVTTGTHTRIVGNRFEGFSQGCYFLGGAVADWSTTRVDHRATIEGNWFASCGWHAIWMAASKNSRITNNHVAGTHVTTHRIDLYPDEESGMYLIRPTPGSGYSDFSGVLHTTYFVSGIPWTDALGSEIVVTEKVSSSLVRASLFAPSDGVRYPFTITSGVAATGVITVAAHGYQNGDPIVFTALTGGTGLNVDTDPDSMVPYYVVNKTTDTFQIAATSGGAAITSPTWSTDITTGFGGIFMEDQAASSGTGDMISLAECSNMVISGNTLVGGTAGGIVIFGRSRRMNVTGNTCDGQGFAAVSLAYYVDPGGADAPQDFVVTGNTLMNSWKNDPNIGGPWHWSVQVLGSATGIISGNTVVEDGEAIEAWVAAAPVPFTIGDSGSDDTFDTTAAHGLSDGQVVILTALAGTGAGSFDVATTHQMTRYYVINKTTSTFQLSPTSGGGAVAFGGTITGGTGTYLGIGHADHWLGYAVGTPDVTVGHNRTVGHINPGIGP